MQKYKFSELDSTSKIKAVKDYIKGWKKTHPNEELLFYEALKLCDDTENEVYYNLFGEVIKC